MSKTRVYELARELGVENKDLMARLEKLGIKNKKPTSSMEDGEVEKVKREFRTSEPHEMEETRVKSTVIRRRAVRSPAEEAPAIEEVKPVGAAPEPVSVEQEKKEEKDTSKVYALPSSIQMKELKVESTQYLSDLPAIEFYPNGGSNGGDILLDTPSQKGYKIKVNFLTGMVVIEKV